MRRFKWPGAGGRALATLTLLVGSLLQAGEVATVAGADDDPLPPVAAAPVPPSAAPASAVAVPTVDYTRLRPIDLHRDPQDLIACGCQALDFSPDSRRLAIGSAYGHLKIYPLDHPDQPVACQGHYGMLLTVAFSRDGNTLLSAACDGNTLAAGAQPQQLVIGGGKIDNTIRLWNAATGRELRQLGDGQINRNTLRTPDGAWILTVAPDGILNCFPADGGNSRGTARGISMLRVIPAPDGKTVLVGGVDPQPTLVPVAGCNAPAQLQVPAPPADRLLALPACQPFKTLSHLPRWKHFAVFSPDARFLLVDSPSDTVTVWDLQRNCLQRRVQGHRGAVTCLAVNATSDRFATGSADATIRIEALTAEHVTQIFKGHTGIVSQVQFLPDGKHLLSVGGDDTVRVWELATGAETGRLEFPPPATGLKVTVSPDGRYLAVQRDTRVELYRADLQPAAQP